MKTTRLKLTESDWQQIRTAYASGIGLREIARSMKIPAGTVLARSQREGWTRQIASAKSLAKPGEQESMPITVTPLEAVAMSMRDRGERHIGRVASLTEQMLRTFERLPDEEQLRFVDELEKLDKIGRRTFRLDDPEAGGTTINVLNLF